MRQKVKTYNDGVAVLCEAKKKETDFNAKINPKTKDDFEEITPIPFGNVSVREEDLDFAEREERTISMKIRVPYCPYVKKKKYFMIGEILYFIYSTDVSKDKTEMYLSLEETRCLER